MEEAQTSAVLLWDRMTHLLGDAFQVLLEDISFLTACFVRKVQGVSLETGKV